MFELVPFKAEHLKAIIKEPINKPLQYLIDSGVVYEVEKADSMTFLKDGEIQVCGGIIKYWEGRGQLWCVFSERSKNCFLPSFRVMKRFVDKQLATNYQRLELSVDYDFLRGRRRAELLGFSLECERARKFLTGGGDCTLYSMVRE